jgi:hypothetical protein
MLGCGESYIGFSDSYSRTTQRDLATSETELHRRILAREPVAALRKYKFLGVHLLSIQEI